MKIKVAIIEDEFAISESLKVLINGTEGFTCSYTFADAESAIQTLPDLDINVVLTDIHLPGKSGIDCIAILKEKCPEVNFLICTSFDDNENIFNALKVGATGYLMKTTPPAKILEAIHEIYQGGSPMNSYIARKIVNSFIKTEPNKELEKLSAREKEIVELLAQGYRYKEIANEIFLSTETIRTHIRNIYIKLQVSSRTEVLNKLFKKNYY